MAVTGVFGWANIQGLQVELTVADEIYAGRETLAKVRLVNTKRLHPSFLLKLAILGETVTVPLLEKRGEVEVAFAPVFPLRGVYADHVCTVFSPFPANFFVRGVRAELVDEVAVFPRPLPLATGSDVSGKRGGGAYPLPRKGYEGEVAKINDYTGSEPMKMIHWRLSAKHVDLKVKEMTAVSVEPVIIDPTRLPGETIEEKLSHAVFLVNALIRKNSPVGLKLKDGIVSPGDSRPHRLRLLRELAAYGHD